MNFSDGTTTFEEWLFLAVFFTLVFVIPIVVIWASYSERGALKDFDVRDLWIYKDRLDKFAVIVMFTWWVHTSSMIMWTLLRTVQTQDYVTYMAWALTIIAKMYAPSAGSPPTKQED